MKILFVCGCIEPGKDGVGDYTRRLATELMQLGHDVIMMSINDKYVALPKCEFLESGGDIIYTLRLPAGVAKKEIVYYSSKWLENFEPDWVSLQFVPFSFHKKGLPVNLGKQLKIAFPMVNWHIMFHELWVGMKDDSSMKTKVWAAIQKQLIKSLIKRIKPQKIQTQTQLYIAQLADTGVNATQLPLFGNIPVIKAESVRSDNNEISLLHFGTIYPNAPIKQFAEDMADYAKRFNKKVTLKILGRSGSEKQTWITQFQMVGLGVCDLGEQSLTEIAKIFSSADFGVATTAYALIEKSGSVAAMREFGLPVICVSEPWKPARRFEIKKMTDVFEYWDSNLKDFFDARHLSPPAINISVTANLFLNTLS